jgi:hypothetical protein
MWYSPRTNAASNSRHGDGDDASKRNEWLWNDVDMSYVMSSLISLSFLLKQETHAEAPSALSHGKPVLAFGYPFLALRIEAS